jgi:hypothetical protein
MIVEKAKRIDFHRRTANTLTVILRNREMQKCESVHELKKAVNHCIKLGQPLELSKVKSYIATAKSKEVFDKMIEDFKGLEMKYQGRISWLEYYGKEIKGSKKER